MLNNCILLIMNELQPMLFWLGCMYKAYCTGVHILCMELYGSCKCAYGVIVNEWMGRMCWVVYRMEKGYLTYFYQSLLDQNLVAWSKIAILMDIVVHLNSLLFSAHEA